MKGNSNPLVAMLSGFSNAQPLAQPHTQATSKFSSLSRSQKLFNLKLNIPFLFPGNFCFQFHRSEQIVTVANIS